jgi:hypothetical protein
MDRLQRARRQRLAGIFQSGSIVAIRHSDADHPEYQYYMAKVLKVGVSSAAVTSTFPASAAACRSASLDQRPTSARAGNKAPPKLGILSSLACRNGDHLRCALQGISQLEASRVDDYGIKHAAGTMAFEAHYFNLLDDSGDSTVPPRSLDPGFPLRLPSRHHALCCHCLPEVTSASQLPEQSACCHCHCRCCYQVSSIP